MTRIPAVLMVLTLLLVACGDDETSEPAQEASPPAEQPAAAEADPAADPATEAATDPAAEAADSPAATGRADTPERAAEPQPPSRDGRRYTAQVAAFLSPDSARRWTDILQRQGLPAYSHLHEVRGRPFHRVRVGVTESVGQARALGRVLTERYHWPVWIAPVSAAEPIPENAGERTRRLLDGG